MTQLNPAVNKNDHIQGKETASLELVEYGDYQCPHCRRAYPVIKNIQYRLGDDLKFIFRNFPLVEMHPDAFNASLATEAAAFQGKFWEMHDIVFENQEALGIEDLLVYAKAIGLDLEQFKKDIQKDSVSTKVEQDFESGMRSGVNGTPSFFINGKKYNGDWGEHVLIQYLKSQLQSVYANQGQRNR